MSTAKFDTLQNAAGSVSVPVNTVVNGSAKAWVNFNGTGTVAIRAAFNVSSITDNGVGDYTVNFTSAMVDANYAIVNTTGNGSSADATAAGNYYSNTNTATACRCLAYVTSSAAVADAPMFTVAIFR